MTSMGEPPDHVVMSFGAGVQSTTLAYLAMRCDDRLLSVTSRVPGLYVFADTGDEPRAVYSHFETMRLLIESSGSQLDAVSRGQGLAEHVEEKILAGKGGISSPPMWVATDDGGDSLPLRRGCTQDFKSKPIDKHLKAAFGVPRGYKGEALLEQWLGISADESSRMRDSREQWRRFRYPLIEMGWKRSHCIDFLDSIGVSAPRSACVFCPFHNRQEWKALMADPVERKRIVAFERMARKGWSEKGAFGTRTEPFLHRSRVPIDEVDFDAGQLTLYSMWENECEGMCGV